jgi:predicted glycogen debranching enzyme
LRTFAHFERDGLIPNNFPDSGEEPMYNTADGTLWLFATADRAAQAGENLATLLPVMERIVQKHVEGTLFGIRMDPADGLLRAGEEGYQLTWMDVKIGDWVVTPRIGKPVEINALWIKALEVMAKLSVGKKRNKGAPDYARMASTARQSFRDRFWYEAGGYLYDVVDGPGGDDHSLRPNQVIALGLLPGSLSDAQGRAVLRTVREKLLTPYGLRSLSPDDPRYSPRYEGDRKARDAVYHQGTVWGWLLGPYFDAVRAIEGEEAARSELERMLPAWRAHLGTAGLGSISEIFDADEPHAPKGCISQAWSVAEVLRQVWGDLAL